MRASLIKALATELGPRHTALLVLASDAEVCLNLTGSKKAKGRTFKSLQEYHKGISKYTMRDLVKDELVEFVGMNYRLKVAQRAT